MLSKWLRRTWRNAKWSSMEPEQQASQLPSCFYCTVFKMLSFVTLRVPYTEAGRRAWTKPREKLLRWQIWATSKENCRMLFQALTFLLESLSKKHWEDIGYPKWLRNLLSLLWLIPSLKFYQKMLNAQELGSTAAAAVISRTRSTTL